MARKHKKHKKLPNKIAASAKSTTKLQVKAPQQTENICWIGKIRGFFTRQNILWLAGFSVLAVFFLILKAFALNAYVGDEHIYLYQGKLVSQGFTPYADFAMAHPPLQSVFTALLFKLFGYSFVLGRCLPFFWCLAGGVIIAVMVRREAGNVASIGSAACYLLAYEPLRASSHFTGVNMTIAILLAAFLAWRTEYVKTCAALCVAAVFTRLYAAPGVIALVIWGVSANPKQGLKLIYWGAGIGTAVFVAIGLWTGFGDMVHNMLAYHAQKTPMKATRLYTMKMSVFFHNAVFIALHCLGLVFAFFKLAKSYGQIENQKKNAHAGFVLKFKQAAVNAKAQLPLLGAFTGFVFLVVLLSMDRVWMYYFVPWFPFGALASGYLMSFWVKTARQLINYLLNYLNIFSKKPKDNLTKVQLKKNMTVAPVLLAAFALAVFLKPGLEHNLTYYKNIIKRPLQQRTKNYRWKDANVLPTFANDLVKWAMWKDTRVVGDRYNSFNYLLWHESRHFNILKQAVEDIKKLTTKNDCIFGDSGTVPLMALISDRKIAANEVDTNAQRYKSGNADPKILVKKIDSSKTQLIILRGSPGHPFGVAGVFEIKKLIKNKYRRVKTYKTAQGRIFTFFLRLNEASRSTRS